MKPLIFIFLMSLTACGYIGAKKETAVDSTGTSPVNIGNYGAHITVVVIDSCEYLVGEEYQHGISIVHKQNCRFCAARKLNP